MDRDRNNSLELVSGICYNHRALAEVAEWQTHQTQNLTLVTMCGFKSHLPHLVIFMKGPENSQFFGSFFVGQGRFVIAKLCFSLQ